MLYDSERVAAHVSTLHRHRNVSDPDTVSDRRLDAVLLEAHPFIAPKLTKLRIQVPMMF